MKLVKIRIENFRQFYGKQCLEFSIDPVKTVTLIHGENNGGKTALLNALRWCLYEETTKNLLNPADLLNRQAREEGVKRFGVGIELIYNNKLFDIYRYKREDSNGTYIQISENVNGNLSISKELPNALINQFLPKEMSNYFFYQGEGVGNLSSKSNFKEIKEAIDKVLGLTVAKKAVEHLRRVKSDYTKDLRSYDSTSIMAVKYNALEEKKQQSQQKMGLLENKKRELSRADDDYESQVQKLSEFGEVNTSAKITLRDQKEIHVKDLKQERNSLLADKKRSMSNWLIGSFSNRLSDFSLDLIETSELDRSHRYTVDKQLLEEILSYQKCICGSPVELGGDSEELLRKLGEYAVDPDLKRRWRGARSRHQSLKNNVKGEMLKSLSKIDELDKKIAILTTEIEEITQEINDSNIEAVKQAERAKQHAKKLRDKLYREVDSLEREINRISSDVSSLESEILSLKRTEPKFQELQRLIQATSEILQLYEKTIESSEKDVDLILLKKMQVLFERVSFNGYSVSRDESKRGSKKEFTWSIVDKKGVKVSVGNGYQAMLSVAFVISLIDFSRDRVGSNQHLLTPGVIAPFIADSILAFIGPDNGRELVRYISESVDQSVFMFSQAQWTESHIDEGLRHKVGKEYSLVQHTTLREDEFKGKYPTRLRIKGREFNVVKFGRDFERVSIEEVNLDD